MIPADSALKKEIDEIIIAVAKEKWGEKKDAKGVPEYEKVLQAARTGKTGICFIDGDAKSYAGYPGNWALTTTRSQNEGQPTVIDNLKRPLHPEDGKPYSGCYVNASVTFWAQNNEFGKTVRCSLAGVQFAGDGEPFKGTAAASADEFEELATEDDDLI